MKKVSIGVDDLATTNPEILKEWNYEKNDILPTSVTKGSSRKVWWICKNCGNEWMATPKNRIKGGTGCPVCRLKKIGINHNKAIIRKNGSLFDNRPDLVKEWDYKKNNPLTPKDVTVGSKKRYGGFVKRVMNGKAEFVIELQEALVVSIALDKKQLLERMIYLQ